MISKYNHRDSITLQSKVRQSQLIHSLSGIAIHAYARFSIKRISRNEQIIYHIFIQNTSNRFQKN